jgi:hypothetical protein
LILYEKKEEISEGYYLKIKNYFNEKGIEITPDNLMFLYTIIYLPFGLYSLTSLSTISIILKFASLSPYYISPKFAFIKPVLRKKIFFKLRNNYIKPINIDMDFILFLLQILSKFTKSC